MLFPSRCVVVELVFLIPKKLQNAVVSRVKVLSRMDISEKRKPQDGRIRKKVENKEIDIRVSTFPTIHGENVVMRLLDKSSVQFGLKELGLLGDDMKWEVSRGGAKFPHLYGDLHVSAAIRVDELPLGPDGKHIFPEFG